MLSVLRSSSENEAIHGKISNFEFCEKPVHTVPAFSDVDVRLRGVSQHFLCSYHKESRNKNLGAKNR